jgi:DNA-binding transcriptional LysR family regulator
MEINGTTAALARRLTTRLRARHFVLLSAIYRHRMLRLVAAELNYSQAAITKALQELEALIGAPLFQRTRRGLVPTAVAELVVARGQTILADLDRLAGDLVALDEGYRGVIRVGIIPYIPQRLLTGVIAKLRRGTKRYRFLVRDGSTDTLVGALLRHELDCVLGRFSQVDGAALEQTIVYVQQPRLVASRRHPFRKRRTLGLAELKRSDWILPPPGTPTRQAFDEMLVRHQIELPAPFIETASISVIKATLQGERLGVALLPDDVAFEFQREGAGRILPLDLDFPLPAVSFIRRREPVADPLVNLFEEALRQSLMERKLDS